MDLHDHPVPQRRRERHAAQLHPGHRGRLHGDDPGRPVGSGPSTTCSRSTTSQQTLALVTRALLTAGVLLLALIAALTWLLTRQIVTPIRMARQVAERLAAGQLQERLRVTGEDDLARLATSFNQMATNLQRQIRQLEELSRVQRRFVSDVSHELRTPLTTVRLAGAVLHDAKDDLRPRGAAAPPSCCSASSTASRPCWSTCSRSAASTPALPRSTSTTSTSPTWPTASSTCTRALADQRNTQVVVHAPDRPCVAEADVRRVERIVRNLVTNAIDHAESKEIVVTVAADEQAAAIAVRDHGVGLAVGESAMVFNRFWRADPARARTSGGTGLGLAISLEDTHLHGGWLQAWGKPHEGAQFRLTLPRHARHPLRHSPLPLVPGRRRRGGRMTPVVRAWRARAGGRWPRRRACTRLRPGAVHADRWWRPGSRSRPTQIENPDNNPPPPQPGMIAARRSSTGSSRR